MNHAWLERRPLRYRLPATGVSNCPVAREVAPDIDIQIGSWLESFDPVVHVVGIEGLLDRLRDVQPFERASVVPLGIESVRIHLAEAEVIPQSQQGVGIEDIELGALFSAGLARVNVYSHRFELTGVVVPGIEPLVAAVAKRSMQIIDHTRSIPRRAKVPLRIE